MGAPRSRGAREEFGGADQEFAAAEIRYPLEIEARERQALEQLGQEQRDVEEQQEQEQDDEGVGTAAGVDT